MNADEELLRRAAVAMREKAEAATLGPWIAERETRFRQMVRTPDLPFIEVLSSARSFDRTDNAAHIASWHPAVALAVADWLDYEADEIGPVLARDGREITYVHGNAYALAVARAYLGEEAS